MMGDPVGSENIYQRAGVFSALAAVLASDETPYIAGTELNIDGGILAGSAASPHAVDA